MLMVAVVGMEEAGEAAMGEIESGTHGFCIASHDAACYNVTVCMTPKMF